MKQLLKLAAAIAVVAMTALPAFAQSANCVFISEYVEGTSNNKALEIFNGTGTPLDMSRVTLERYNNGSVTPSGTFVLTGATIPVGGVYVIVNPSASAPLAALGDPTYGTATYYNGDDALVLYLDGLVVDSMGQVGFDPGSLWGTEPCTTKEHTLRRKIDVCCGDTIVDDAYDPALEWDCFDQDDFTDVGSHTSNCISIPVEDSSWSRVKSLF
jgi:uncharacterized protein